MTEDRVVRVAEAAEIFSCSKRHLYNQMAKGEMPPKEFINGIWGWRMSTIQSVIDGTWKENTDVEQS